MSRENANHTKTVGFLMVLRNAVLQGHVGMFQQEFDLLNALIEMPPQCSPTADILARAADVLDSERREIERLKALKPDADSWMAWTLNRIEDGSLVTSDKIKAALRASLAKAREEGAR